MIFGADPTTVPHPPFLLSLVVIALAGGSLVGAMTAWEVPAALEVVETAPGETEVEEAAFPVAVATALFGTEWAEHGEAGAPHQVAGPPPVPLPR